MGIGRVLGAEKLHRNFRGKWQGMRVMYDASGLAAGGCWCPTHLEVVGGARGLLEEILPVGGLLVFEVALVERRDRLLGEWHARYAIQYLNAIVCQVGHVVNVEFSERVKARRRDRARDHIGPDASDKAQRVRLVLERLHYLLDGMHGRVA